MDTRKELNLKLDKNQIETGEKLRGFIMIRYSGRYDSLVINSQIEDSSDIFNFISVDGKNISHPYARLSLLKHDIPPSEEIEFTIKTSHVPLHGTSNAKLRVSLIQEHKEIVSIVTYLKITEKK